MPSTLVPFPPPYQNWFRLLEPLTGYSQAKEVLCTGAVPGNSIYLLHQDGRVLRILRESLAKKDRFYLDSTPENGFILVLKKTRFFSSRMILQRSVYSYRVPTMAGESLKGSGPLGSKTCGRRYITSRGNT
jgi:hypothetical protein